MTLTTEYELIQQERRRKDQSRRMKRVLLHALADQVYAASFNRAPKETIEALLQDMRALVEG